MRRFLLALALPLVALPAFALATPAHFGCGGAVPLSAETLQDLGLAPDLLDGENDLHACFGKIQPGARMTSPGCTFSFVFRDDFGNLYISTAGHCVGSLGRRISAGGVGQFGSVVYVINQGVGRDFGLVRVDADKHPFVEPTLCHWGGPSKMAEFPAGPVTENPEDRLLLQYGWGYATQNAATRARAQYADSWSSTALSLTGLVSGGDSGSATMFADGGAAGVVTHAWFAAPTGALGPGYATRLDHGERLAEAALGLELTLVTSDVPVTLTGA